VYFESGVLEYATCAADPYSGEFGPEYLVFYAVPLAYSFSRPVTVLEYAVWLNTNIFSSRAQTVMEVKAAIHSPQRGVAGEGKAARREGVPTVRRVTWRT